MRGVGMYEDLVASVRNSTEAAVRESQEHVDLALDRAQQADRAATEASKAIGRRWADRIKALRRRAAGRVKARSTEMDFGGEEGLPRREAGENDELVSLTDEPTTPAAAAPDPDPTPPLGVPQQVADTYGRHAQRPEVDRFLPVPEEPEQRFAPPPRRPAPPRRPRPADDDDEDYSGQSWLQGR